MPGIKSNGNALFVRALFQNVVCESLSRLADYIDIHTVDAGTDDPAKACCSKSQVRVKPLFDLVVIILNVLKFLFCSFIKIWIVKPFLICFLIVHSSAPPLRFSLCFIITYLGLKNIIKVVIL